MTADKIGAMALSLASAAGPSLLSNDLTTWVLGVQLTTVAGAVLGTLAAIGYDEQPRPRGKLFALTLSTTILASALVGVVPRWLGWSWSSGGVEAGLGALAAVGVYYLLPPATKRAGELIRAFTWSDLLPWRNRKADQPAAAAASPEGTPDK